MVEATIVYVDASGNEKTEARAFRVLPSIDEYIARSRDEFL